MSRIATGARTVFLAAALGTLSLAAAPQSAPEPYARAWATFLGGSAFERAQGCAVDAAGNVYIVGNTGSTNLPVTPGAFQTTYRGDDPNTPASGGDGYVAKISADGRTLLWCTYLGGTDADRTYGVQVDAQGFVYVTTWTASADFPVTAGAYDTTHNSPGVMDVAYTKIRPDGSGLVWSTFVGGSGTEQARGSIFVDPGGHVWSSGWTNSPNFPTTAGAFQRTLKGSGDAFLFKLSADGSQLLASTLFGGSHATFTDTAYTRVTLHSDGTAYISGITRSTDLPVTSNAFQRTYGGDAGALSWHGDAFVARFNAALSGLVYATYLGGSSGDEASVNNGLTVDPQGRAVVLGNTTSTNFPTTAGAFQRTNRGGQFGDGFVAVLSADGSQLVASTLVGGTGSEETSGIALDTSGNVYFSGNTQSADYPVTSNAFQSTYRGGSGNTDAWFSKLSPTLSTLLYSTYLGGSGTSGGFGDRGRCLVLDGSGAVLVTGDSNSADFPVTAGSYDTTHNGGVDSFVAKFSLSAPSTPGTLQFGASAYSVGEAGGQATVTVTRAGGTSGAVGVSYATSNGTATAGADYSARSGTLSWAAGDASPKTFTVPVLNDGAVESSETVTLSLSAPTGGAALGSPAAATLTILDDDAVNAPPPPGGVAAMAGDGRVTVVWSPSVGASSYTVYSATSPGVTRTSGTPHAPAASPFVLAGLSNGTTRYFVVTASNAGGESGESAEVSATPSSSGWPVPDADGDGYSDAAERAAGSDPADPASRPADTDGDGLGDAWEQAHFGGLSQNASGDPDGDGANNLLEASAGTDPNLADTDGDGVNDFAEIQAGTDPLSPPAAGGGGSSSSGGGCGATGLEAALLALLALRRRK
jgi:hypothetical protein